MQKNKHKRIRINKKQPTKKTRIYTNSDITFSTNIPETVERLSECLEQDSVTC